MKCFLDGHTLYKFAKFSGFDYKRTAIIRGNFIQDLFRQWVQDTLTEITFTEEVEIDESVFSRRCKYPRGNPKIGVRIWILGIVERSSNRLLLFPVDRRDEETRCTLTERHVAPGTTIFTDGWAGYQNLNVRGFRHFSIVHKETFVQKYKNVDTNEVVEVHTNQIEGAWKHTKDHSQRINGTKQTNF